MCLHVSNSSEIGKLCFITTYPSFTYTMVEGAGVLFCNLATCHCRKVSRVSEKISYIFLEKLAFDVRNG